MFYKIRFTIKFKFIVHCHDAHQSVQLFKAFCQKKIQVIFCLFLFTLGILFIHNIFFNTVDDCAIRIVEVQEKKNKIYSIVI